MTNLRNKTTAVLCGKSGEKPGTDRKKKGRTGRSLISIRRKLGNVPSVPGFPAKSYNSGAARRGGKVRDLWHSLMHSPEAWIIGAVVGLIIFAIFDLLPVGESKIRSLIRLVKNKISEHSTAQLEKRIKELEKYRDSLKLMMASDKLLYLGTFRTILGTLIFMCIGAILLALRHSVMLEHPAMLDPAAANSFFALDMGTIFIFTMAIVVAISGVSMALLDTRPKLEEQISKYDKNITDLKEILKQQREKLGRRA